MRKGAGVILGYFLTSTSQESDSGGFERAGGANRIGLAKVEGLELANTERCRAGIGALYKYRYRIQIF